VIAPRTHWSWRSARMPLRYWYSCDRGDYRAFRYRNVRHCPQCKANLFRDLGDAPAHDSRLGRPLIMVTNDDGFESDGLWTAVEALLPLGEVLVAAPDRQWSGRDARCPTTSRGGWCTKRSRSMASQSRPVPSMPALRLPWSTALSSWPRAVHRRWCLESTTVPTWGRR
jgi:hypothetical protein